MKLLLNFDGVMITTPAWKPVEGFSDGFIDFNEASIKNLKRIINLGEVDTIILTTTHRIIKTIEEWEWLFKRRGISVEHIEKINDADSLTTMKLSHIEIEAWAQGQDAADFIIIDDDAGLNQLPAHIKERWIKTNSLIGLNDDKTNEVLAKIFA